MLSAFRPDLDVFARGVLADYRRYCSGGWTDAELARHRRDGLRDTLRYVRAHSPYFARHLDALNDRAIDDFELDQLEDLPFTTKDDLRRHGFDVLSRPVEDASFYYETTGTTGSATPCPRDDIESIQSNTPLTLCCETILCGKGRRHVVGVAGPTELHSFGDTLGDVCRNLDLAVVKLWPPSPLVGWDKALDVMKAVGVTALMCTPGMALSLARHALRRGIPTRDLDVDVLMVTGELASPAMLRNIAGLWNAEAYNFLYGSQEAFVLAAATASGALHTFPLNYVYEVIDPATGGPAPARADGGQVGELVVTMLFRGSKPLVRYRTGDLVCLRPAPPEADMPSPTVEVLGRTNDMLQLGGKSMSGRELEQLLLSQLSGCLGYQLTLSREAGAEKIDVELDLVDSKSCHGSLADVAATLRQRFGVRADVRRSPLGEIGGTGAMVSWKAARIVDARSAGVDAERAAATQIARRRDGARSDPLSAEATRRHDELRQWLEARPLVRLVTLGPPETSSCVAARHLTESLSAGGLDGHVEIVGLRDFGSVVEALKARNADVALFPNAYEGMTRVYWDQELEFMHAFQCSTPPYLLAAAATPLAKRQPLRIASCPAVEHLLPQLGAGLLDGADIEIVRTPSTHAAAALVVAGAADAAVTNEPSARRHSLAGLAVIPGVPMLWSLFRRRGA
jgi:phenylacetate-CoA ligase